MSRFIDKLKQASQSEPQPMGFRKDKSALRPRLLLLAEVGAGAAAGVTEGADAVLLEGAVKSLPGTDLPAGIWLSDNKGIEAAGIDFVIFTPEMPVTLAGDEKTGRVMVVEASLEVGLLRSLDDLPLDALFIAGDGTQAQAVTWRYLMLCKRFAALSSKPVLAAVSPQISKGELQMLWEMGVDGVVVTAKAAGDIKKMRSLIDSLTPPSKRKRQKARAILPQLKEEAAPVIEDDEEEEE